MMGAVKLQSGFDDRVNGSRLWSLAFGRGSLGGVGHSCYRRGGEEKRDESEGIRGGCLI